MTGSHLVVRVVILFWQRWLSFGVGCITLEGWKDIVLGRYHGIHQVSQSNGGNKVPALPFGKSIRGTP